jgi:lipopolysaccharide biosynthesis glycosyltransferase
MNETLTFVYCFDKNYYKQGFSSIISLLDTSLEKINIIIIYNLNPENIEIPLVVKRHKNLSKIKVFEFKDNNFNFPNLDNNHISAATYYRLFIDNYISNNTKTIFYIDADIIFLKNSISLFKKCSEKLNNSNFVIAARTEKYFSDDQNEVFSRLNINQKYFNAGVLIINLKLWREQNIQEKLIQEMKKIENLIIHWDQDVMNSFFNGDYQELNNNLNFDSSDFNELNNNVKLLHYIGSNKPWYMSGVFNYGSEYYHENFNKFNKSRYHIVHLWKKSSVQELLKSILNLNIFKLRYPIQFLKSFLESLK